MLNSCNRKNKSLFECNHTKSGSSNSNSRSNGQFYNLNVEVYLKTTEINNGTQSIEVDNQIFKGVAGVRFKKKYILTDGEYQLSDGFEVSVRVPAVKIRAGCDLNKDLKQLRFKYLNLHTKNLDIVSVSSYEHDGWGSTMLLSGYLNYSENS